MRESLENYDQICLFFLNTIVVYGMRLDYPFPEPMTELLLENHSTQVLSILLHSYRQILFQFYREIVQGNLGFIIHDCIQHKINVPDEYMNQYYEENPLLGHEIISETYDIHTCDLYLNQLEHVDPTITNNDGRTVMMNHIVKYRELAPQKYMHNPELEDDEHKTCQDLWIAHIDAYDIPNEIRVYPYVKLTGGCKHANCYEFVSENKLYCKDCIKDIKTPSEKVFMNSSCSICYEDYTPETSFGKYKHCQHVLCEECAKKTTVCPFCAV